MWYGSCTTYPTVHNIVCEYEHIDRYAHRRFHQIFTLNIITLKCVIRVQPCRMKLKSVLTGFVMVVIFIKELLQNRTVTLLCGRRLKIHLADHVMFLKHVTLIKLP